jgi:hypothetical protein
MEASNWRILNMRKVIIIFLAVALVAMTVPSYGQFTKRGTVGFKFLDIGVGGRALALGEAYTAIANDASAIFWNPAGLGNIKNGDFFAGYTKWPADIYLYSIAAAKRTELPMLGTSTVGIAGTILNTGLMNRTDEIDQDGTIGGTFPYEDYWFGVSYAKYLTDRFCFGATGKFVHETIDTFDVNNWAVDIGAYYETGYKTVRIGLAILNFGPDKKYDFEGAKAIPLPLTFRAGAAMDILQNDISKATLMAELAHPSDNNERYQFGCEYWLKDAIALRGGYKINMDEGGFTAGAGFKFPFSSSSNLSLDYAYNDWGRLKAVHRVSTSISF